jgi:hypothetical protein
MATNPRRGIRAAVPLLFPLVSLVALLSLLACALFETRDRRFYYRAPWNFALRERLPELEAEFNGVDFGHAHLYETLLLTGGRDVEAVDGRARLETLRFIRAKPMLPPSEEAIAPTYMRLAWRAQNTFDEAHALHRATYDIYASDYPDKDEAVRRVLEYYRQSPYAITGQALDHRRLDSLPFAKTFRRKFPLFNATIWSYHYLQIAAYDLLLGGHDAASTQQGVTLLLEIYHGYLDSPPVHWTFMPLTGEYSPRFAAKHPEVARIFDNLHMLHDTISDILSSDLFPTRDAKRAAIYEALDSFYLAGADATNPMILREDGHPHHGSGPEPATAPEPRP